MTAEQKAKLDAAKAKLNAAQSVLDSATADANTKYSLLGSCVKGKGTTNNCSDGQPLGSGAYPAFGSTGNPGACKICNSLKDCKSDCCNEATCSQRMTAYNSGITAYNTAKAAYDTAKKNYDTILNEVDVELSNDPDTVAAAAAAAANAQAQGNANLVKWIIIGGVIFLLVGGWVYFKFIRKGKGAGAGAGGAAVAAG